MITARDVVNAVRDLAIQSPDNQYHPVPSLEDKQWQDPQCFYTKGTCDDGTCGCIIGQALMLNGIPRQTLAYFDEQYAGMGSAIALLEHLHISSSETEKEWIRQVQWEQDKGLTWKTAIATVDSMYRPG